MHIPFFGSRCSQTNECSTSSSSSGSSSNSNERSRPPRRREQFGQRIKPRQEKPPPYPSPTPPPKPPSANPKPPQTTTKTTAPLAKPVPNATSTDKPPPKITTTLKPPPNSEAPEKQGGPAPTKDWDPQFSPNANAVLSGHTPPQTKINEGTQTEMWTRTLSKLHRPTDSTESITHFIPDFPPPTHLPDPFSNHPFYDPPTGLSGFEPEPSLVPVFVGITLGSLVLLGIILALLWRKRDYRTPWRREDEKDKLPDDLVIPDAGYWPTEKTPMPIPRTRTPLMPETSRRAIPSASVSTTRLVGSDDGHSSADHHSSGDDQSNDDHSHLTVQRSFFGRLFPSSGRSASPSSGDSRSVTTLSSSHLPFRPLVPPASPSSAAPLISIRSPSSSRPQVSRLQPTTSHLAVSNPFTDMSESGSRSSFSDSGHGHSSDSGHGHLTSDTSHTHLLSSLHLEREAVSPPFADSALSTFVGEPASIIPSSSPFGDENVAVQLSESDDKSGSEWQYTPEAADTKPRPPPPVRADTMTSTSTFGLGNDPPPEYKAQSVGGSSSP